jgi:tripartite-type tricarboxylate transporter receptor subunit TctC
MFRFSIKRVLSVAVCIGFLNGMPARADNYPGHPVTLVVPLSAGSTGDIVSRILGTQLSKELGQAVIIENKPGAGGTIAIAELARDKPDGYTIGFVSEATQVINLILYKRPGYSQQDFAPISMIGSVSNVLVVPPKSKFNSIRDIVAEAKANAGTVTYSSGGNGTSHHLSSVLFAQMTGTDLVHVPYKGAAEGTLAVMSGEVDMAFYNTPTELNLIKSGKLKALAVTGSTRSPLLPQVPTLQELGLKGYQVSPWMGFVAPAATKPEIISRLHDAFEKVLAIQTVRDSLQAQGVDVAAPMSSQAFSSLIQEGLKKWTPIVKSSGAAVN